MHESASREATKKVIAYGKKNKTPSRASINKENQLEQKFKESKPMATFEEEFNAKVKELFNDPPSRPSKKPIEEELDEKIVFYLWLDILYNLNWSRKREV